MNSSTVTPLERATFFPFTVDGFGQFDCRQHQPPLPYHTVPPKGIQIHAVPKRISRNEHSPVATGTACHWTFRLLDLRASFQKGKERLRLSANSLVWEQARRWGLAWEPSLLPQLPAHGNSPCRIANGFLFGNSHQCEALDREGSGTAIVRTDVFGNALRDHDIGQRFDHPGARPSPLGQYHQTLPRRQVFGLGVCGGEREYGVLGAR